MTAFTDKEKVDIRRYCGYQVYGTFPTSFVGYRFFVQYGLLEYRMSNMSDAESDTVRVTYLSNLYLLEQDIVNTRGLLETDQAGPFKRNAREVRERTNLFNAWRTRLVGFLGIAPGPELNDTSTSVRIVV